MSELTLLCEAETGSNFEQVRASYAEGSFMTRWIGAAFLPFALMIGGSINPAAAAPLQAALQEPQETKATDIGSRHRTRHHHRYAYRSYDPYYYDRPVYYAPAPFVPFNFGAPLLPPPWWW